MLKRFGIFTLGMLLLVGTQAANFAPVEDAWQQKQGDHDFYLVHKGDTLYSIAWAFDLDYRALAKANHLEPPYELVVGQHIRMIRAGDNTDEINTSNQIQVIQQTKPPPKKQIDQSNNKTKINKLPNRPIQYWAWPAQGKLDLSPNRWGLKKGISIKGKLGEPIRATAPGIVVYRGHGVRGYGNLIIIKHNNSYLSAYAFNKRLLVKQNEVVKRGQKIALMGNNTNNISLLYFEIRHNGRAVNPLKLLKKQRIKQQ